MKDQLMPLALRINAVAGAGISPDDLATTLRVLRRMSENLTRDVMEEAAS